MTTSLYITRKTRGETRNGRRTAADAGVGICPVCRAEITLTGNANRCRCGCAYNAYGVNTKTAMLIGIHPDVPAWQPKAPAMVRAAEIVAARRASAAMQGGV